MILLVGDRIKLGHIVEALEQRLGEQTSFVAEQPDIRKQENDILLAGREASAIIYDTRQYLNDGAELVDVIKRIYRANRATVILLCPTDNPNNEIVKAALSQQIRHIVNTALSYGGQKEQLEKIFAGYFDANPRQDIQEAEEVVREEVKTLNAFVGELYDASQREQEREHTVVIRKKGTTQVILDFLSGAVRTAATVASILLMAIAILALLYENTRTPFLENMAQIWEQIRAMF